MPRESGSALWFEVLGSVRAWRGDVEVDLGSAHRRAVLAVLALSAGDTVSRPDLVRALWGETPPPSASGSIYTYISGLRQILEPGRAPRSPGGLLASAGSGYSLRIDREHLDVHCFDALRAGAGRLRKADDPHAALADLDAALALWHGDALAGIPGPFAEAQRTKLGELRLTTVESRAQILLQLSRHDDLVAELTALCKEHPLREKLQALLMRALHGSGRTAEALEVYATTRAALVGALGIEPGPELRGLHQRLLSDETPPAVSRRVLAPRSARQPPRPDLHVGREDELSLLRNAVSDVVDGRGGVVWVEGEPGIGKSALLAEGLCGAVLTGPWLRWTVAHELDTSIPLQILRDCLPLEAARAGLTVEQVLDTVERLCADGPLILVADDFQWADEASLQAWTQLAQLVDRLPLLLVTACRPVPCTASLERLRRHLTGFGRTISLRRLPERSCLALAERLTGAPVPGRLRRWVEDGGGNPRYIREILASLAPAGLPPMVGDQPQAPDGTDRIPPARLVSWVSDHLTFLSPPARSVLRWAALLGNRFTVTDLAATTGQQPVQLAETVEEALRAGVLSSDGEWLRFCHPLVRKSLYEKTPSALRVALHHQFAETLVKAGAPATRVAEQLAATPTVTGPWISAWLPDNIGTIAAARPQVAVRLLRQLIGFSWLPADTCEALSAMLTRLLFWLGGEPVPEARSVLVGTTDPACAAEMRWILGYVYYRRDQIDDALGEVRRALADRRTTGSWRARHELLHAALSGRRIRRAGSRRLDPGHTPGLARFHTGTTLPGLAELRLLDEETDIALEATRFPFPAATWQLAPHRALPAEIHLLNAVHHYWTGNWRQAQAEVDTITAGEPGRPSYVLRHGRNAVVAHSVVALIEAHRDEPEAALRQLQLAVTYPCAEPDRHEGGDFLLAARSAMAALAGRLSEALEILAPLADPPLRRSRYLWLPGLARLALNTGDQERTEQIRRAVEPQPVRSLPVEHEMIRAYCHGLLADEPDEVLRVATFCRTTGRMGLIYARAREDAAWLLARHGRMDEAGEALRSAVGRYRAMGAVGSVRRAEDRMRPLGIPQSGRAASVNARPTPRQAPHPGRTHARHR
jgi:DNA-binding SARP family transcriptional activator